MSNLENLAANYERISSGDLCRDLSAEDIAELIRRIVAQWYGNLKSHYMDGVDGAPDWLEYEHKIWALGEELRLLLQKRKDLRGGGPVMDTVASVLSESKFGKGRQTFALLLGQYGDGKYGDYLGQQLEDSDVLGHCVDALRKAKILGYETDVAYIAETSSGWIKNAAKAYVKFSQSA